MSYGNESMVESLEAATLEDATGIEPNEKADPNADPLGGQSQPRPATDSGSEDAPSEVEWEDAAYSLYRSLCKAAEGVDARYKVPDEEVRRTSVLLGKVMAKHAPSAAASMPELLLVASLTSTWAPKIIEVQKTQSHE